MGGGERRWEGRRREAGVGGWRKQNGGGKRREEEGGEGEEEERERKEGEREDGRGAVEGASWEGLSTRSIDQSRVLRVQFKLLCELI